MTWILPKQLHTSACALDTAALISDSNEQSQIFAQSLFLRSKPSPARTWSRKWNRVNWTQHLFGRILKLSLGTSFATEWMSSLVATHASPSVAPENDLVPMTLDTSGPTSQMELFGCDLAFASSKMSKVTFHWDLKTSYENYKDLVTAARLEYSQRLKSGRHTSASECSSWPTVTVADGGKIATKANYGQICLSNHPAIVGYPNRPKCNKSGKDASWPTPNAADSQQGGKTQGARKSPNLSISVHGQAALANLNTDGNRPASWAKPRAEMDSGGHRGRKDTLHSQVKVWPTATVGDGASSGSRNLEGSNAHSGTSLTDAVVRNPQWATPASCTGNGGAHGLDGGSRARSMLTPEDAAAFKGGKLNPRWVETLMGLPIGWTMPSCMSPVTIAPMNCDCSATELCPPSPTEPSLFLPNA